MFDGLQILSNTTKHHQTPSNSTKQGVQRVNCLITKQCLMVFGRQTFPVSPGPNKHRALHVRAWTNDKCSVATKHHQTLFGEQTFYRLDTLHCLVLFDRV